MAMYMEGVTYVQIIEFAAESNAKPISCRFTSFKHNVSTNKEVNLARSEYTLIHHNNSLIT